MGRAGASKYREAFEVWAWSCDLPCGQKPCDAQLFSYGGIGSARDGSWSSIAPRRMRVGGEVLLLEACILDSWLRVQRGAAASGAGTRLWFFPTEELR